MTRKTLETLLLLCENALVALEREVENERLANNIVCQLIGSASGDALFAAKDALANTLETTRQLRAAIDAHPFAAGADR